ADRLPLSARRWAQLTARRSEARCSLLDCATAQCSPLDVSRSVPTVRTRLHSPPRDRRIAELFRAQRRTRPPRKTAITMFDSTRLRATIVALATLSLVQLGCGGASDGGGTDVTNPPSSTGAKLVVMVQPLGNGRDADGFSATLDGTSARTVADDPTSVTYDNLSPGDHTIRIAGVAPHCSASADSITHTVKAGTSDTVTVGL